MTSNVSQNYPYSSESEAERAAVIATPARRPTGPVDDPRGGVVAGRPAGPLVGLEVPDEGLPGPAPRGRLRVREARRVRRLRRDLRQDLPALSDASRGERAGGRDGRPGSRADRPARPRVRRRRHHGLHRRLRLRLRAVGARGRVLDPRRARDELDRVRRRRPVRGRRLRGGRSAVRRDHPADGAAQRPPPALLRGPSTVDARRPGDAASGHGPLPDRRELRAGDRPLPPDRRDRRTGLLDLRPGVHVPAVEPGDARRRGPRRRRSRIRRGSASTSSSRRR